MQIDFHTTSLYATKGFGIRLSSAPKFRDIDDKLEICSASPYRQPQNLCFIDSTGLGVLLGRHKV